MPGKRAQSANGIPPDSQKPRTPRKSRAKNFREALDRFSAELHRVPPADGDEDLLERAAAAPQLGPIPPEEQREAQATLWERFGASPATLAEWSARECMRAREALALCQGLDPDAVFRGPDPFARLSRLVPCFTKVPGEPLREFERQLLDLARTNSRQLEADCGWFVGRAYACELFTEERFPRIDLHRSPVVPKHVREWTPLLRVVDHVWQHVGESGVHWTNPMVSEYIHTTFPWVSSTIRKAIAQIIRPTSMAKGRPRTRPPGKRTTTKKKKLSAV